MSTSTISLCLSQIFFLTSYFQNPLMESISFQFSTYPKRYMVSQRKPITNIIRRIDKEKNIYAMDSDNNPFESKVDILLFLGKVLERMYTMPVDDFNQLFLKEFENQIKTAKMDQDYHRFMSVNNEICLRSQIDCMSTLPNGKNIVYEIKSRAVAPMRYDLENYTNYFDYKIDRLIGTHSSFEREYYDLIRGGFLKYFFQLKIGRMDGAMIGYHNTKQHFGFEYINLSEIEEALFGDKFKADQMFVLLTKIMTVILDNVIAAVDTEKFSFFRIGRND